MLFRLFFSLLLSVSAAAAQAAMTIEIVGGAATRIPVAVLPFSAPSGVPGPAEVVVSDLGRSGYFRLLDNGELATPPATPQDVQFPYWKTRGADAVVFGKVQPQGNDRVEIRFWLYDVVRQTQLAAYVYTTTSAGVRAVGHRISDVVHQTLLGEAGAYGGRIAYILKRGGRYELQVADADSQNAVTVAASPEPLISPAWSPDGRRLAYVSFEDRKAVVYVQNLADGSRKAVAKFRGSNSAPAWSPDGRRLAVALSKDETSQIYLLDMLTNEPIRFTRGGALDTEPVFSPDGKWLYFTSGRGGSPQIYRADLASGATSRVTFEGSYNVSPAISPDGRTLAFVHRRDGRFHIAAMDLNSRQMQVLTETANDESPSFASNGRMLLYATLVEGRGVLATVSVDGKVKQRLSQSGDLREPAWGP